MIMMDTIGAASCLCVGLAAAPALARSSESGGLLAKTPVLDAPFSADATTTLQQTLADGTRISRSAKARYFRDRLGRVRVEQTIVGLEALNPAAEGQVRITIRPDPSSGWAYTLDPVKRTATKGGTSIADSAVGGGDGYALPLGGVRFLIFHRRPHGKDAAAVHAVDEESLGSKRIAGVDAAGHRVTMTIPTGLLGNDRPMQVVDEVWESPDLKVVVYARRSDPRTGILEYRLTNLRRTEPPHDLFVIPANYSIEPGSGAAWISLEWAHNPPVRRR
jgi:hypothetical protein